MTDPTFCFALDDPPRLVSASDDAEVLLGFSREDFLKSRVCLQDRIHADDADIARSLFSPEIENPSATFNIRLRHADGRIRCLKGRYAKERARGQVLLHLRLEDARNVREPGDAFLLASFKTLIEHTSDHIYLKNRNHVFLAASRAVPNLTESAKNPAELVGKTDYDIHPEEIADIAYRLEDRAFAEGRRVNENQQLLAQDGSKRWIDNRKYPINGPDGEIIGIFGAAPDITEHIETDQRLRQSEESLREAQKIAGLGSYFLDIPAGVWTSSDILDEIFGIDRTFERTVAGWLDLVHAGDRMAMSTYFQDEVLGRGKPFDKEYRIVRRSDGVERWVHGLGKLTCDPQGRPVAMRGIILDITEQKQAEAALRESKNLLQLFIEHAPVALAMLDREMRYLSVSQLWLEIHGLRDRQIIGRSHYEVLPDLPKSWRDLHRRVLAGETIPPEEAGWKREDGRVQWFRREIRPWLTGDGGVGGLIIFSEDITERKLAEERLKLAATVFTGAREGIAITDPSGTILEVNDAFMSMTGYSREEVLGHNPRILQSGLHSEDFYKNMWDSLLRKGVWSGEIWNRRKGGDIYPEVLTIHAIRDAAGKAKQYVSLSTDITEAKEREQQLELAAHFDALTGLPNRALFGERLRQAMTEARGRNQLLAVAYLDLDGFKAINDSYGQSIGDALLTALAFRMKRALREDDTLARLGGDEFAAVMPCLDDAKSCVPVLNRLLGAAAKEAQVGDFVLRVSASAGVTFYPQPEEVDADLLLRQAGEAMYQAKLAGGNSYLNFDPDKDLIARSRHQNRDRVRHALAARELVLYYQPKVNMRTGKVVGAEALLRWQHPERGLLPPGMFLPVVEDQPLATEIGDWLIESALTQMEAWRADGFDLPVSVNVSAFELQQPEFADRLRARLAAHPRLKPSSLELEVLETSALQDVVQSSRVLKACSEIGVSIALDDFGAGYSSLTYLKRLPANVLKIDQSFVRDMLDEPENLTILEGVLGLAAAFHRQVIAEGVETAEHGLMLLEMGCDLAQGFGIARPMPARDLKIWAANWRPDARWADIPQLNEENRMLLRASVEHNAWLAALEAFLEGKRATPPPLTASQCRLGAWLKTERHSAHRMISAILAIETLHQQLHALAAEIYGAHSNGRKMEGPARLRQLHYLHDKCMKRLKTYARTGNPGKGVSPSRGEAFTLRAGTD